MTHGRALPFVRFCWCALMAGALATAAHAQVTRRASESSIGSEGNGASTHPTIDRSGRLVAFETAATNLVSGDANGATDVLLHDAVTGATVLVSLNSLGVQGNGNSDTAHLAALGQFLAFRSDATNMVAGDVNGVGDIFLRDLSAGTTRLVSRAFGGGFANGDSFQPFVTADGRFVAFASLATALLPTTWDGDLLVLPKIVLPHTLPAGGGALTLAVPELAELEGVAVFLQVLELDPGASKGVSFSEGLRLDIGW